ncbi:hypothetical protein GAO09_13660 [Rhizobiales bacterium RZME27]|uniref:Uncharacterized protein n=3 Tax=Endobacterium cereale TaxID=2663029 RepID=A0A6A8ABL5_9HYPH|nr:hypothetical protein [Endobacterium cereale]
MNALIDPRDDVAKVMNAVEILSHGFYRIDGIERDLAKIKVLDPSKNAALATSGNDAPEELLRKVLTTDIYNRLYNRAEAKFPRLDADMLGDFVNHLSQANCGEGAWQDGWSLLGEDPQTKEMVLRFDGVMFWAQKEAVRLSADGEGCRVRAGKEHRFLNAHFYMALGDTCVDALGSQPGPLLRFFWHLTAEAAIDYIAAITKVLNQAGICFRTKVLSSPHEYNRSDAGVLYIHAA